MMIARIASSAIPPSTHQRGLVVVVVVSVCVCLVVVLLVCAGGLLCVVVVVFCAKALRANGARPRVNAMAIALTKFVRLKDFTVGFSFSQQIRNEEKLSSQTIADS
jgi:hypothetical protein